jgi:hypothetical protein
MCPYADIFNRCPIENLAPSFISALGARLRDLTLDLLHVCHHMPLWCSLLLHSARDFQNLRQISVIRRAPEIKPGQSDSCFDLMVTQMDDQHLGFGVPCRPDHVIGRTL